MPTHSRATQKVTLIPKTQSTVLTAASEFFDEYITVHSWNFTFGSGYGVY